MVKLFQSYEPHVFESTYRENHYRNYKAVSDIIQSCGLFALVGAEGSNIVHEDCQHWGIMTKLKTISDTY
jgi:hypothetical protein